MPYIPYTDEQKQLAGSVDLPTFLRMRGEKLVHVDREFKLVYLAEYALAGSVFFSQKTASNQDCDRAFSLSKQRLGMLYHPYRDRCRSTVLYRDLSAKIADVMQDLKNYARTEEQTRITADKLYDLADYSREGTR